MKKDAIVYDDKSDPPAYEYTGKLTELFRTLELSTPYYTSVMRLLREMRCVEQTRRGGGGSDSKWMLFDEPSSDLYFDSSRGANRRKRNTKPADVLQQQINDLNKRMLQQESLLRALMIKAGM